MSPLNKHAKKLYPYGSSVPLTTAGCFIAKVGIDLFTVVYFVTWPLNESEAGVDLVMIQTSLLFLC